MFIFTTGNHHWITFAGFFFLDIVVFLIYLSSSYVLLFLLLLFFFLFRSWIFLFITLFKRSFIFTFFPNYKPNFPQFVYSFFQDSATRILGTLLTFSFFSRFLIYWISSIHFFVLAGMPRQDLFLLFSCMSNLLPIWGILLFLVFLLFF